MKFNSFLSHFILFYIYLYSGPAATYATVPTLNTYFCSSSSSSGGGGGGGGGLKSRNKYRIRFFYVFGEYLSELTSQRIGLSVSRPA